MSIARILWRLIAGAVGFFLGSRRRIAIGAAINRRELRRELRRQRKWD